MKMQRKNLRDLLPVDAALGLQVTSLRYNAPADTLIASVGHGISGGPQRLFLRGADEDTYREIVPSAKHAYWSSHVVSDGAPRAFVLERSLDDPTWFVVRAVHLPDGAADVVPGIQDPSETHSRKLTVMRLVGVAPDSRSVFAIVLYNLGSASSPDADVENKLVGLDVATGVITPLAVMPTPHA